MKYKSQWGVKRKTPYTEVGIKRLDCIRCGDKAIHQWQICADGNNFRPICDPCDIKLNTTVLKFMRHPHAKQLAADYEHKED